MYEKYFIFDYMKMKLFYQKIKYHRSSDCVIMHVNIKSITILHAMKRVSQTRE